MERNSESDLRRLQHSKNDVKWPPSWWIMHLFTMRYISSPEIPCLCINCRFLVCSFDVRVYMYMRLFSVVLLIASSSPVSCICTHLFSSFQIWWYNCAWMILYLYCIYTFTGEPCHLWNFCFLLLSFLFCLEKFL